MKYTQCEIYLNYPYIMSLTLNTNQVINSSLPTVFYQYVLCFTWTWTMLSFTNRKPNTSGWPVRNGSRSLWVPAVTRAREYNQQLTTLLFICQLVVSLCLLLSLCWVYGHFYIRSVNCVNVWLWKNAKWKKINTFICIYNCAVKMQWLENKIFGAYSYIHIY